jgi:hypothetical protein
MIQIEKIVSVATLGKEKKGINDTWRGSSGTNGISVS